MVDTGTMIKALAGLIHGIIEHSENRLQQAKEDIAIIEDDDSTFEERMTALDSLKNHIGTVKSDMIRAELNF